MHSNSKSIEEIRERALRCVLEEDFDRALALYDEALGLAEDPASQELLIIGKADVLLAAGSDGPEIQQLPSIMLRRRSSLHTFLSAYALMFKWRLQNDVRRAETYGKIALEAARATGQPLHIAAVLNELGNIYELDSRFEAAVESFEEALVWHEQIPGSAERRFATVAIIENLGYSRIQTGDVDRGLQLILSVLDEVPSSARSDANLDAALGYLRLGDCQLAQEFATAALDTAVEPREIRNAHYLLGEIACRLEDYASAEYHFDQLVGYFPEFPNLKTLLFAVDLLPMLNLRL